MTITNDENMPIAQLIGYMLKIIKSGKDTSIYKDKFNAIKHGDYDCFYNLIGEPQQNFLAQFMKGETKTDNFSQVGGDTDIALLNKIEPSIIKFGNECFNQFGDIRDADISDLTFCRCAAFEIAMRAQKNKKRQNENLPYINMILKETIDVVCDYFKIPDDEKELLHRGRDFVNMIKGHEFKKGIPYFSSWKEGEAAFVAAWVVCNKYQLKLCY